MNNKTEIAVGALTIIGIIAFILGYKFLKGDDVFSRSKYIVCVADRTSGLLVSNEVLENGVSIGRVSEILLSRSSTYPNKAIFLLKLNSDVEVPKDSRFQVVALDMLGKMGVALIRGKESTFASENDTLPCTAMGNSIEQAVDLFTQVKPKLESLMSSVEGLVNNMNNSLGSGENNLLKKAMTDLSATLQSVNKLTTNLDHTFSAEKDNLHGILTNVNKLTATFNKESGKIDSILSNFNTLSSKLAKIDLEETVGSAKNTLEQLQLTLKKVNEGDGSIAKLLNDDALHTDISNTLTTLTDLLNDLKKNPKKYISLSLIDKSKNVTVESPTDSLSIMSKKKVKIIDNK
ncbi:MAG: MCE family protein [Sphingobacteriales bacterium]|nr:MAG: MCE family protein [Sphingobacteriales bacterium]